jgi:DNA repair exonuclease SbcCD ATPase subunit
VFRINRLILIDSYKPGTLQELRLDGPTNLNGVNGAGKTTLLRLIPLFFGESPSRLVPKSRVNESFVQHYLPHESSYLIFEYRRSKQTCLAVMYAATNGGGLCYRFVDKAFTLDDFLVTDGEGGDMPISCRDLARHLGKKGVYCSPQLTSRNDYRTVIQNLPHTKGSELRQLIARFSFCEYASGRRLQHVEKIVTGMFMRATDFRDLREMLVSCIEEERETIALDIKTDTLEVWCREYRAFQHMETQRETMIALEASEQEANTVRQELAELAARMRRLASRFEEEHQRKKQELEQLEHSRDQAKTAWETQELTLKQEQAETQAQLKVNERSLHQLEQEKISWEKEDIELKQRLHAARAQIRNALEQAREHHRRLLEKVQDIDAEFRSLKAEQEKEFLQRRHARKEHLKELALQAEREKNRLREEYHAKEAALRQTAVSKEAELNELQLRLREEKGQFASQVRDVQADPDLLLALESKREALELGRAELEQSREQQRAMEEKLAAHRANAEQLDRNRRQLSERRRQIQDETMRLHCELEADAHTLLGFLREHHPTWTNHIAKVIKPELLLRDDLSPALAPNSESFYGISLGLDVLEADRAASESALREAIANCQRELDRLDMEAQTLDTAVESHRKTGQVLAKEHRAAELSFSQAKTAIERLANELSSLEAQIRVSKTERQKALQAQLDTINQAILDNETRIQQSRKELANQIKDLKEALSYNLTVLDQDLAAQETVLKKELDVMADKHAKKLEELERQRIVSLAKGGVDTATLNDLEKKIRQLATQLEQAEQAAEQVEKYQRWRQHEWPRHETLRDEIRKLNLIRHEQDRRYQKALEQFQVAQQEFKARIAELNSALKQIEGQQRLLSDMLSELERFPRLPEGSVVLDASHSVSFLQKRKHELLKRERTLAERISHSVTHIRRALNQFPGTRPASYAETVVQELGLDASERAWLPYLRNWFDHHADEFRRVLVMEANTFGSAVRNYHQALCRFDRGIDALSRRLTASIDRNIGFEKIEAIQARLLSQVEQLGYWQHIKAFTEHYDSWQRAEDLLLPTQAFADAVQQVASQLSGREGRVETRLVNLLTLEIAVTENGKVKRATHEEELRQISSHGLSYLILCVFFVALINMIRKDQPVTIIWPMDELKDLHQMNIERLLEILNSNNITLLSAFPDPDPEVLKSFKNRYEIYGYRELVEMVVDEDDMPLPENTAEAFTLNV